MDLAIYTESGILELFVLDLLNEVERAEVLEMLVKFPVLKQEVQEIESTLHLYADAHAIEPSKSLKAKIETSIAVAALEQNMDMNHLSLISTHSDYRNWLSLIAKEFPTAFEAEEYKEVLRAEDGITQVLVVTLTDIDTETHDDVHESFLILRGQCKCTVGEEVFYLNPGGFTQIPLNENHKVEITSAEPVMAIAQYVAV